MVSCADSAFFLEGGGERYISAVVALNVLFRNGFAARTQVSAGCGFRGPGRLERGEALACFLYRHAAGLLYEVLAPNFGL